jgi:hypothetical protein
MKSKSLLIFLLGFSKMLVGQDSLTVETVQDSAFVTPQYSSVYDDVFMNKKETKWLFKVDALGLINLNGGYDFLGIPSIFAYTSKLKLGFEHKLSSRFSLDYSLGMVFKNALVESTNNFIVGLEPRWYISKSKSDAKCEKINNLNGNYISLNGSYSINYFFEDYSDGFNGTRSLSNIGSKFKWALTASYGIQRRVFNNWYFDYQMGISYGKNNIFENYQFFSIYPDYSFHNKFTLGLAFGKGKKSQTNTCDIFRCFEEENSLLKLDIRNIFKNRAAYMYEISINPEFEKKLGKSPFSINTGLGFNYRRRGYSNINYGIKGSLEPRYYYNLKKRIAQGKSANNLSGSYFSIELSGGYGESINESYISISDNRVDTIKRFEMKGIYYAVEPKWGIQKRLFRNGYMDFSFSLFRFKKSFINSEIEKNNQPIIQSQVNPYKDGFQFFNDSHSIPLPNMYFKIGFAF